jgi:hypothetical protein
MDGKEGGVFSPDGRAGCDPQRGHARPAIGPRKWSGHRGGIPAAGERTKGHRGDEPTPQDSWKGFARRGLPCQVAVGTILLRRTDAVNRPPIDTLANVLNTPECRDEQILA